MLKLTWLIFVCAETSCEVTNLFESMSRDRSVEDASNLVDSEVHREEDGEGSRDGGTVLGGGGEEVEGGGGEEEEVELTVTRSGVRENGEAGDHDEAGVGGEGGEGGEDNETVDIDDNEGKWNSVWNGVWVGWYVGGMV